MIYPSVNLRAMEPEDLDILYAIENDVKLWNAGNTNVPYSHYALHDYIAHASADIYADKQVRLMIDNAAGETVGIIDIINFDPRHSRAELGIVIQQAYRNKGYAHAAVKSIMNYTRDVLHLHQLYVIIANDNESSTRLFNSIGFTDGSLLNDWLFDGKNYHDALLMRTILDGSPDI